MIGAALPVDDPIDASQTDRGVEVAGFDFVEEMAGHVEPVLDDAAVHVDDVEVAVGTVAEVNGAKSFVGGGEKLRAVGGLSRSRC